MRRFQMLIGSDLCDAARGDTIRSINPATEDEFAEFPSADAEDVDRAVNGARAAAPAWSATDYSEREVLLRRIAAEIRNHAADLAVLETEDSGKPIHDTTNFDIPDAAYAFEFFAGAAWQLGGETIPVRHGVLDYTTRLLESWDRLRRGTFRW